MFSFCRWVHPCIINHEMPWTPDAVREAIDSRDPYRLRELAEHLIAAVIVGRARLLKSKPWLPGGDASKEDDVQDGLTALFANSAAILRKFGVHPEFRQSDDALRRFVTGVTYNVLQRKYQKRRVAWNQMREDLTAGDDDTSQHGLARLVRVIDLEEAVRSLSAVDQALFHRIYVEQQEPAEICAELGIADGAFQARKSRLLKRLRKYLDGDRDGSD